MVLNFLKKDSRIAGIIIGILLPVVVVLAQHKLKFDAFTLQQFIHLLATEPLLLTSTSTLALIANGLLFGVLVQFKKLRMATGLFIPTLIFGVVVLIIKLRN